MAIIARLYTISQDGSPRNRFVLPSREGACRTVRTEQRNAHDLAGAVLDGLGALVSVEVRTREGWRNQVDLDFGRLQLDHHGERDGVEGRLGRGVDWSERRVVGSRRVCVRGQRSD